MSGGHAGVLISVIVPIYNIEHFLDVSLNSVINQSIGFGDNIELVLVDDGSSDGSAEICQRYADCYPNNIKLVTQKNAGVSAARNRGLKMARGKFIHFFDGDDILSRDYYAKSIQFLNIHSDVDFVASKIKFFDEIIDSHPLNFKFKTDRVIDVGVEPNNPILHVITCVFRSDSLTDIEFDERLVIAEDVRFISDVLLRKQKYGVIKSPVYNYRKRSGGGSAIGGKLRNLQYYKNTPRYAYQVMLDSWAESNTSAIEYTILYDMAYIFDQKEQTVLTDAEQRDYLSMVQSIISRCSDESIVTNAYLSVHKKLYALTCKYGERLSKLLHIKDKVLYFGDYKLYDYREASVYIDFLTDNGEGSYMVEGYTNAPLVVSLVELLVNDKAATRTARAQREESFLGDVYFDGGAFSSDVTLVAGDTLGVSIRLGDATIGLPVHTGPFTRFDALPLTYRRDKEALIKREPKGLRYYAYSRRRHVLLELRMLAQICMNWRIGTVRERLRRLRSHNLAQLTIKGKLLEVAKPWFFMAEAVCLIPRAILLRLLYYAIPKKRPIWLVQDRGVAAGDNGEALFRYISQQDDCPADVYFVISAKFPDYQRMKQYGKVLNQNSLRYKFMFLRSDKIISSQADIETDNPFLRQRPHYANLFTFDFVFLQHGIIRYDLSDWLNRYNKNIRLFVTSAQKEYDSMFSNPYYYPKNNILLSGLPRYDYLQSEPKKKLILAPTYRKNLARMKTDKNGARRYDPLFKQSDYFTFYNNLMNDQRLRNALNKAGMVGEYYIHPVFAMQARDFNGNDEFTIKQYPFDYKDAFREGELLISDHSSVVFDFAYLKKPVIYAYFDVDTFFEGHSYNQSDFFSDEKDGFGPVFYDYETLVEGVIDMINDGNKMNDNYRSRVDKFFYKVDTDNSKRVYEAIRLLDNV